MTGQPQQHRGRTTIAWQGFSLVVPEGWNPVRLEGDFREGQMVLADLRYPRIGLRWKFLRSPEDAPAEIAKSAKREVGVDDVSKGPCPGGCTEARLHEATDLPGRDVWTGFFPASQRLAQVVYHTRRRDHVLQGILLPSLSDQPGQAAIRWRVFGLDVGVPVGMKLARHHLVTGEHGLLFQGRRKRLWLREVVLASLALKRLPLERWLRLTDKEDLKMFKALGQPAAASQPAPSGQGSLPAFDQVLALRRRYAWLWPMNAIWGLPSQLHCRVVHDVARDRLVHVAASDPGMLASVMTSMLESGGGH